MLDLMLNENANISQRFHIELILQPVVRILCACFCSTNVEKCSNGDVE